MATTRDKLLICAQRLFAERGFYGTSLSDVAGELGVSKQALLHHFASKEKLYGEVLQGIATTIMSGVETLNASPLSAQDRIESFIHQLVAWMALDTNSARIIMRELLDNQPRAATAARWYLQPLIEALVNIVEQGKRDGQFHAVPALPFIYSVIGAAHYYAVSLPTLQKMLAEAEYQALAQQHEAELIALVRARLINNREIFG